MTKARITQRLHSGQRDDYNNIGGVYITATRDADVYVTSHGTVLSPMVKDEVRLRIGPSLSEVTRPEMGMRASTVRLLGEELLRIADTIDRGLRLPEHKPSTLLFTDANGDTMFMGDLDAGRALAAQERYELIESDDGETFTLNLCDDEDRQDVAEWGTGKTAEEAWRYALGAYFGPDDDGYDEGYLRAALTAGRWPEQE